MVGVVIVFDNTVVSWMFVGYWCAVLYTVTLFWWIV